MARSAKDQPCIFCGSSPCACNGPVKKVTPKKKALAPKQTPVASVFDEAASNWTPPDTTPRFKKVEAERAIKTVEQLELEQAIRNLEPILADQEKRRYQSILNPTIPAHIERQVIEWRRRNGKG